MKRMMKKLDHWNSQISSNDKLVRELQERERDMVAAMDAKDSQLAILKVRLQEADQELRVMQNKVDELSAENERYCYNYIGYVVFMNSISSLLSKFLNSFSLIQIYLKVLKTLHNNYVKMNSLISKLLLSN